MILHITDWKKYPGAMVHLTTRNTSFVELALIYKKMGVKNHAMILALHNPDLEFVDPFSPNLTEEQMSMIGEEVAINPWYYIREVVRVPAKSGVGSNMFKAGKGSVALFWLFFNNIPQLLIQPRQTGKTFGVGTLTRGLLNFWVLNTDINLVTKDIKLRTATVELIKDIENEFPWYLKLTSKKDTDNKEGISVNATNNKYLTQIGQNSLSAALNAARGLVSSIFHIDEFGYIHNIEHMLSPALAAGAAARQNAKNSAMPYGTIFTTTSARRDIPSGEFAYGVYSTGAEFVESLYDVGSKEALEKYTRRNTTKGNPPLMVVEYNHRQLGYTDEWLVTTMEESRSTGLDAEADFLNKWPLGGTSSPIDAKYLEALSNSEVSPTHLGLSGDGFAIRWYVDEDVVTNDLPTRELVLGIDTSDAVGQDDIAIVISDVRTGETIGAGQFNDLNTQYFAVWLSELLITYKKMVLIIERRSTGTSIIDTLIIKLLEAGEDPFKRIFNWVVNDHEVMNARYKEIEDKGTRSYTLYEKFRKYFGFATSGGGRTARSRLYGETLLDRVKFTAGVARDKRLILQINGLKEKNGRIDHDVNNHDDLVIAWLLCYWFLSKAKNIKYYGINPNNVLSNVVSNSTTVKDDLKAKEYTDLQLRYKNEITKLIEQASITTNLISKNRLISRIRLLEKKIDSKIITGINISDSIAKLFEKKKPKLDRKMFSKMFR